VLRALGVEDADAVYAYARDPAVTEFVTWEPHTSIEQTVLYLMTVETAYRDAGLLEWGVTLAGSGELIGTCGFARLELDHARGEIGYVVGRAHAGQGYATEAAAAVLRYGFAEIGLHRIEAQCVVDNAASARVLEKIGMRCEGVLASRVRIRGRSRDVKMFARLARAGEGHG